MIEMSEKEELIEELRNYRIKKKKIELLSFELENSYELTDTEIIEALSLGHAQGESLPVKGGHISDKTMKIALHYEDISLRMRTESLMQIKRELHSLKSEINRIEYYVGLLDSCQEEVIRFYYFDGKTWPEIKEQLHTSQRALIKRRDDGVNELVKIYCFVEGVKARKITSHDT